MDKPARIALLLFLVPACLLAQESVLYGRWAPYLRIDQFIGVHVVTPEIPPDSIVEVFFEEHIVQITHKSGDVRRFTWQAGSTYLDLFLLTQKGDIWIRESESLMVNYDVGTEGTLVLIWPTDQLKRSWYLLRRAE